MRKSRTLISTTALLAACSGGSAWSPTACACTEPWSEVASFVGQDGLIFSSSLTADTVRTGLSSKFKGRAVGLDDLPDLGIPGTCHRESPMAPIQCRWWLWESGIRKKGFEVVVRTDDKQMFKDVSVKDIVSP